MRPLISKLLEEGLKIENCWQFKVPEATPFLSPKWPRSVQPVLSSPRPPLVACPVVIIPSPFIEGCGGQGAELAQSTKTDF